MHERVDELRKNGLSGSKIAAILTPECPEFKLGTLEKYVRACLKLSRQVIDFYASGDISFTVLMEFGQSQMESATIDFFVKEFIDHDMVYGDAVTIKDHYARGMSAAEIIMRVTGQITSNPQDHVTTRLRKEFDGLLKEAIKDLDESRYKAARVMKAISKEGKVNFETANQILEVSAYFAETRAKVSKVIDLLPVSTLNLGQVHSELFHRGYLLRHLLKEHLEFLEAEVKTIPELDRLRHSVEEQFKFVDTRVAKYFDEIQKYMSSEAWMAKRRKETQNERNEGEEGR